MYKNVYLIVNPASGADFPILAVANRVFKKHKVNWEVFVTHKRGDAEKFARSAMLNNTDIVIAYGGDGTIMEVARGLATSDIPLMVVPGGTANVLAKDLAIPQSPLAALELIDPTLHKVIKLDTFTCNGKPYLIRINAGVFADFIIKTKRKTKDTFGSFAYALTMLTNMDKKESRYKMIVDGKKLTWTGVGLMIANIGSIGFGGMSVFTEIEAEDGSLDVILLKDTDVATLTSFAADVVLKRHATTLKHTKGKKISLVIEPSQLLVFDDEKGKGNSLEVEIVPRSLNVIVPK